MNVALSSAPESISSREFVQRLSQQQVTMCLDVRTVAEFAGERCRGSECLPLQQLSAETLEVRLKTRGIGPDETLYLMCQAGKRAEMAAQRLAGRIGNPLCVVAGGVEALPEEWLERAEKPMMSLERQVRIAAGALVLLGVVLAATVSPWAMGLSAFVGAGLVFAGVTDTCAMGLLLARMPWNNS
ncbi:rhodanese-like domain-containing protein [Pseudomaricurvus alkylphenolicus]|jgi:rhodanese-related sulfurtransferase|uniref:rhodanese-like domain-containing protein n=1 Tax=Pseudomaricurvus alkylphenolicus TaxID=1306991 RepID=UPI0014216389|nr:rhodanese-like domain-containing protein [Pseudomaricurvus alkylphenolicus]NIB39796.1 rhodanese-like domain-containing protein [Pseudomaricurvus alkylphenolicus]